MRLPSFIRAILDLDVPSWAFLIGLGAAFTGISRAVSLDVALIAGGVFLVAMALLGSRPRRPPEAKGRK